MGYMGYIMANIRWKYPIDIYHFPIKWYIYIYYLVAGWPTPLKNISSSVGRIIPNKWKYMGYIMGNIRWTYPFDIYHYPFLNGIYDDINIYKWDYDHTFTNGE